MLPIQLKGKNLGERHRQLNTLVNEAFKDTESCHLYQEAEERTDADRLFKIDLANKCRNVTFILSTLKSDDMLYVSRALKATWLITDDKYSYIINPEHLHTVLFPQMYYKAVCKLKFQIRQHLRCEKRCELFCNYEFYELNDIDHALLYLPYCSRNYIEDMIRSNDLNIPDKVVVRICERFYDLAELILQRCHSYQRNHLLSVMQFNGVSRIDYFMQLFEKYVGDSSCRLSRNISKFIVKKHPSKIFNHPHVYLLSVTLSHICEIWSRENIEKLIELVSTNKSNNLERWFCKNNVTRLLKGYPEERKNEILEKYFPVVPINDVIEMSRDQYIYFDKYGSTTKINQTRLCRWFRDYTFENSFKEIKELIRATQDPDNRNLLLLELITFAGDNSDHIYMLLTYYFQNHMNEMRIHKTKFLDRLCLETHPYRFNEKSWKVINDLFISVETYGACNCANYNEVIVYYHILHDLPVPDKIMEKFRKSVTYTSKSTFEFNDEEKSKIFLSLNNDIETRCEQNCKTAGVGNSEDELRRIIKFLNSWDKRIVDSKFAIELATEILRAPESKKYTLVKTYHFVIIHHILNDTPVPEDIINECVLRAYPIGFPNLTGDESNKMVDYFIKDFEVRSSSIRDRYGLDETLIELTQNFIAFLNKLKKNLHDYPYLISLMKSIVIASPNRLSYPKDRSTRRLLFEVSLLMSQKEEVLLNIIKFDAELLERYFSVLENNIRSNKIEYRNFLRKILTYIPINNSDKFNLTQAFQNVFKSMLKECEKVEGGVSSVPINVVARRLALVHKKDDYIKVIKEYLPNNHKVEWSEEDINIINIRKGIAMTLSLVRPISDLDTVVAFAKGDYLQYALPSLWSFSIAAPKQKFSKDIMPKLLNSPVSVQKHGITLCFRKLSSGELIPVLTNAWTKSKNISIRNTIFINTIKLLEKQVKEERIMTLWQLVKSYITKLQEDEERNILSGLLSYLPSLPKQARCECCQICYKELKQIQEKIDWPKFRTMLLGYMRKWLTDGMDLGFVEDVMEECFLDLLAGNNSKCSEFMGEVLHLFVEYLASSHNVEEQSRRLDKVAKPMFMKILMNCYDSSSKIIDMGHTSTTIPPNEDELQKCTFMLLIIDNILNNFISVSSQRLNQIENGFLSPLKVYNTILNMFDPLFSINKKFDLYLKINFLIFLEESRVETDTTSKDSNKWIQYGSSFAIKCGQFLDRLLATYFPSIQQLYRNNIKSFLELIYNSITSDSMALLEISFINTLVQESNSMAVNLLGVHLLQHGNALTRMFDDPDKDKVFDSIQKRIHSIDNEEIKFNLQYNV